MMDAKFIFFRALASIRTTSPNLTIQAPESILTINNHSPLPSMKPLRPPLYKSQAGSSLLSPLPFCIKSRIKVWILPTWAQWSWICLGSHSSSSHTRHCSHPLFALLFTPLLFSTNLFIKLFLPQCLLLLTLDTDSPFVIQCADELKTPKSSFGAMTHEHFHTEC